MITNQNFNTLSDIIINKNLFLSTSTDFSFWGKKYISLKKVKGQRRYDWTIVTLNIFSRFLRSTGLFYQDTQYAVIRNGIKRQSQPLSDHAKKVADILKTRWFAIRAQGQGLEKLPNKSKADVARKLNRTIPINETANITLPIISKEVADARGHWLKDNLKESGFGDGYITSHTVSTIGAKNRLKEGACIQNENMEDTHLHEFFHARTKDGQNHRITLFMICDGHGNKYGTDKDFIYKHQGNETSKFVQNHIIEYVKNHLEKNGSLDDTAIFNALKNGCVDLNNALRQHSAAHQITAPRKGIEVKEGVFEGQGCTANINLLINNQLWTANIGDSRSILLTDSEDSSQGCLQLSEDATLPELECNDSQEDKTNKTLQHPYARSLTRRGGSIYKSGSSGVRIDGLVQASVPRAFGDFGVPGISARPKIHKINLNTFPTQRLRLIVACDGIWDTVSPKDASLVARDENNQFKSISHIAREILSNAFERGSEDNNSVMVVNLK